MIKVLLLQLGGPGREEEEKVVWIQPWLGVVPLDVMEVNEVSIDVNDGEFAGQAPDHNLGHRSPNGRLRESSPVVSTDDITNYCSA